MIRFQRCFVGFIAFGVVSSLAPSVQASTHMQSSVSFQQGQDRPLLGAALQAKANSPVVREVRVRAATTRLRVGGIRLVVPKGAIARGERVRLQVGGRVARKPGTVQSSGRPVNVSIVGGGQPRGPVYLHLPYRRSAVPAGLTASEALVPVSYRAKTGWQPIPFVAHKHSLRLKLNHFSWKDWFSTRWSDVKEKFNRITGAHRVAPQCTRNGRAPAWFRSSPSGYFLDYCVEHEGSDAVVELANNHSYGILVSYNGMKPRWAWSDYASDSSTVSKAMEATAKRLFLDGIYVGPYGRATIAFPAGDWTQGVITSYPTGTSMLLDGLRLLLPFSGDLAKALEKSDNAMDLSNRMAPCARIGSSALNGGSPTDLRNGFKCIASALANVSDNPLEKALINALGTAFAIADGLVAPFTVIVEEMKGWNRGSLSMSATRGGGSTPPPPPAPPGTVPLIYHVVGVDPPGLAFRSAPTLSAGINRRLLRGTAVEIVCQVAGDPVLAYGRTTIVWNKTAQGDYASDAYFDTPTYYDFSANIPRCAGGGSPPPPPPAPGGIAVATTSNYLVPPWKGGSPLNVRTSPSISAPVAYTIPTGTVVRVSCQAVGSPIGSSGQYPGNSTWDRLTDGNWIHDALTESPGGIRVDLGGGNFAFFSPGWPRC